MCRLYHARRNPARGRPGRGGATGVTTGGLAPGDTERQPIGMAPGRPAVSLRSPRCWPCSAGTPPSPHRDAAPISSQSRKLHLHRKPSISAASKALRLRPPAADVLGSTPSTNNRQRHARRATPVALASSTTLPPSRHDRATAESTHRCLACASRTKSERHYVYDPTRPRDDLIHALSPTFTPLKVYASSRTQTAIPTAR